MTQRVWWMVGAIVACGKDPGSPPTDPTGAPSGSISVVTRTTGVDEVLDHVDDYTVALDGALRQPVAPDGEARFDDVPEGLHELTLEGVAETCVVQGADPVVVGVLDGQTTPVTFEVDCLPAIKGRLVYHTVVGGSDYDVFSVDPDGTRTVPHGSGGYPALSPDGTRLAVVDFVGTWDVYVADADGSNRVPVTGDALLEYHPAWSPDGSRLAFTRRIDSNEAEIVIVDTSGSGARNRSLLADDGAWDGAPSWTPDGQRIVFQSDRAGTRHIFSIGVDGTGLVDLTPGTTENYSPKVSPDGTTVAFDSTREGGDLDVFLMDIDGSDVRPLVSNDDIDDARAAWSPDGSRLVFTRWTTGELANLWVVGADGSDPTQVTDTDRSVDHGSWSPPR